jgi:uncharacterized protein YkwD
MGIFQAYCARPKLPESARSSRRTCLWKAPSGVEANSMRRAVVLLIAGLSLSAGASSVDARGVEATRSVESSINTVRAQYGCGPLRLHAGLARAAGRQARLLLAYGRLDHNAGMPFAQRLQRAAPDAHLLGEDLGFTSGGGALPNSIVQSWMHSPPHRSILLDCRFSDLGVGVATGSFGSRGYGTVYAADLAA